MAIYFILELSSLLALNLESIVKMISFIFDVPEL